MEPRHLRPAIEQLERFPGEPIRLILVVPPRHAKSETVLHKLAQLLWQHPHLRQSYASYAQTFSETQAIKVHRYARAVGVTPNPNMANRQDWQTLQGGGLFVTSIGGEFTGRGTDFLVIDDPVKGREQADSPTYREKTWAWWEDVAETRLEPGAGVVVIMTRWHADDLAGRLIRQGGWMVIRLPALADGLDALGREPAPDPLGREVGEALWPERYDRAYLEELRAKKPYTFAALYQGLPRPREGALFGEPEWYGELPGSYRLVIGLDLAYSKKRRANHSALTVFAVTGNLWHVRHVERWQEDINGTLARLERVRRTYPGAVWRTEGNGPQKGIFDLLKDKGFRVEAVHRANDKYAEAQAYAEAWNAGRVLLPDTDPPPGWLAGFLEEHRDFTGADDAEDDQVDAAVNGYKDAPMLAGGLITVGGRKA